MLVSDLLDASRIVLGKLHVEREPLFLRDAVREAIAVIRSAADANRIAITTDGLDNGDRERLKQVVWNLLANAVKFTPKDGAVRVRILADRRDAIVEVADDGGGIDDALLRHVFDRFTQGASTAFRKGGLRLGLSIARHIIELHDGSVQALQRRPKSRIDLHRSAAASPRRRRAAIFGETRRTFA